MRSSSERMFNNCRRFSLEGTEMKVLIACECSQTVCTEFRKLGVECYSCDIEKEYGGHPEWHIQGDVLNVLHGNCEFKTNDGEHHYIDKWDLVVAHPPCTYFCMAQNGLYDRKRFSDEYVDSRLSRQMEAFKFFLEFTKLGVPTVIENPPGKLTTLYRKANQTIQPYQFGDAATKATCLWLFGLPKLQPTKQVIPPPIHTFASGNTMGGWFYETSCLPAKDRARARSKTFPGIAKAIATQYTRFLKLFCGVESCHFITAAEKGTK